MKSLFAELYYFRFANINKTNRMHQRRIGHFELQTIPICFIKTELMTGEGQNGTESEQKSYLIKAWAGKRTWHFTYKS